MRCDLGQQQTHLFCEGPRGHHVAVVQATELASHGPVATEPANVAGSPCGPENDTLESQECSRKKVVGIVWGHAGLGEGRSSLSETQLPVHGCALWLQGAP